MRSSTLLKLAKMSTSASAVLQPVAVWQAAADNLWIQILCTPVLAIGAGAAWWFIATDTGYRYLTEVRNDDR